MYASSTVVLGALLALARVAVATPPACLLAALQVQTNPSDIESLCGNLQNSMIGNITEKCSGTGATEAKKVYADTCLSSASVTVTFPSSTSSSSGSSSTKAGSSSATAAEPGSATATPNGSSVGSGGSGSTTGTGTAASSTSTTANSAGFISPSFFMAIAPLVLTAGFAMPYLL